MSRGSSPAIFHSLACTLYCKSLSLSLSLFLSHPLSSPPFVSLVLSTTLYGHHPYNSRSLPVARLYLRSRFSRWRNKRKRTVASIMRATLSQRDQQRLNCIRDSRTAHKFSSLRRGFLLNTRRAPWFDEFSPFIPSFSRRCIRLVILWVILKTLSLLRHTFYHSLKQSFANKIDLKYNLRFMSWHKFF